LIDAGKSSGVLYAQVSNIREDSDVPS
jgi:hypothetical protein